MSKILQSECAFMNGKDGHCSENVPQPNSGSPELPAGKGLVYVQ